EEDGWDRTHRVTLNKAREAYGIACDFFGVAPIEGYGQHGKAQHTPGPWTLETVRTSSGLCHKVGPFPWKQGKENHACIYDDYPALGSDGTPELVANARLIAAAPDMLAALKAQERA